jgi:hypothetical protein
MKYDPYHIPSLRTYAAYLVEKDVPDYVEAEKLYLKAVSEIEKHVSVSNLHLQLPNHNNIQQGQVQVQVQGQGQGVGGQSPSQDHHHSVNDVTVVVGSKLHADKKTKKSANSLWFRFAGDCLSAYASLLCTVYSNNNNNNNNNNKDKLMMAARYFLMGYNMCEIVQHQTLCDAGILFKNYLQDHARAEEWFELAVAACARDEKMTAGKHIRT